MLMTVHQGILESFQKYDNDLTRLWDQLSPVKYTTNYVHDLSKVNHFFHVQLGLMSIETLMLRELLVSERYFNDWLDTFEHEFIPFIIEHGLPIFNENGYKPKGLT